MKRKKLQATMSFGLDEEDASEAATEAVFVMKKKTKNPAVDTSFLPDKERDEVCVVTISRP